MKRRTETSSSRSSASRPAAARASAARANAARARTNRASTVKEGDLGRMSKHSSPSPSKTSKGRQKVGNEKLTPTSASDRGRTKSRSAASSGAVSTTSHARGKERSNVRVLPRGVHPNDMSSGVRSSPKRMKVSVQNAGTSPASTLTTLSLKSLSSTSMSSKSRSTKSSAARSTSASTAIRKLAMEDKEKNNHSTFLSQNCTALITCMNCIATERRQLMRRKMTFSTLRSQTSFMTYWHTTPHQKTKVRM